MLRTASMSAARVGCFICSSALAIVVATDHPYMLNASSGSDFGEYRLSAALYSLTAGSFAHFAVCGSLKYAVETIPLAFWSPTGLRTRFLSAPTLLRMCRGFQPDLPTAAMAWAENFGVVMSRKVSAPELESRSTCAATVGSVTL